jgi:hypothetical protein
VSDTRSPGYGQVDRDYGLRLATTPPEEDGPIWMVNLMAYREHAIYDGAESDVSGRDADDRYAPLEVLADIGAEVVFHGDVAEQLLGDEPRWDRVGIVRYPTRRSFIDMQRRDDFRVKHVHKEAGMAQTIVVGCTPIPSPEDSADAPSPVDWSDVPHPPTDDDGPVLVLHLCRFHPGMAETEMASYTRHAVPVAARHGGRVGAWFEVEGTIVGDGRTWDQARFNVFPSKAAFMAVVLDPDRLRAQAEHREVALADTYTLILRPSIDRLAASVAEAAGPGS